MPGTLENLSLNEAIRILTANRSKIPSQNPAEPINSQSLDPSGIAILPWHVRYRAEFILQTKQTDRVPSSSTLEKERKRESEVLEREREKERIRDPRE